MKQLTCEMCGGKDLVKDGGVFVCQSCGCQYSVEEAKKMMIEGTVEVKGKVSVDSSDALKNFIIRGNRFFENKEYDKAEIYYNKALDIDAKNAAILNNFLEKANELFKEKQYQMAEKYYNNALYIDEKNQTALNGLDTIDKTITEPNLFINRLVPRSYKARSILTLDGNKYKKLNIDDQRTNLTLGIGNHILLFSCGTLKSNPICITIQSRKDKYILNFKPGILNFKINLFKEN